jgi:hypothetical protein
MMNSFKQKEYSLVASELFLVSFPLFLWPGITCLCWTDIVSTLLLLDICSLNVLLAHSIAVNTSYRSFGYYKPGQTNPPCIRLVIRRKWETLTFSFYSLSVGSVLIQSHHDWSHVISWHAQSAPDHFWDSFQSLFIEKLEDLTGTCNSLCHSINFIIIIIGWCGIDCWRCAFVVVSKTIGSNCYSQYVSLSYSVTSHSLWPCWS